MIVAYITPLLGVKTYLDIVSFWRKILFKEEEDDSFSITCGVRECLNNVEFSNHLSGDLVNDKSWFINRGFHVVAIESTAEATAQWVDIILSSLYNPFVYNA